MTKSMDNKITNFFRFKPITLFMYVISNALYFTTFSVSANPQNTPQSDTDDSSPIEVLADKLEVKAQSGVSTYSGNVVINRGSTQLSGDKVVIYHPNKKFEKAIATGKQAKFKRYLPEEDSWVNGRANEIIYNLNTETAVLTGNAYVNQQTKNSIAAPKIVYNLKTESLSANRQNTEQERIRMIFTPQNNDDKKTKRQGRTP